MSERPLTETGWAIKFIDDETEGFYVGWWLTRIEAIRAHCQDLGQTWELRRKQGDRAVKVTITEVEP